MDKIRKGIDFNKEDIPYLQMLAAKKGQHLKNMVEEFIHQLALSAKQEEFKERIEEYTNKTKFANEE